MHQKKNLYEVLGLSSKAHLDDDDIKKAYRQKALQYHPDRNSGNQEAEEKFKDATESYEILKNPILRKKYDSEILSAKKSTSNETSNINDSFDVFSGEKYYYQANLHLRVNDTRYNLTIKSKDSIFGKNINIKIPKEEICHACRGSKIEIGMIPETCTKCKGTGQIISTQDGSFNYTRSCSLCNGLGVIITSPCTFCMGKGSIQKTKSISVKIPQGIKNGQYIKVSGEGRLSADCKYSGDLYIIIHIQK